MYNSKNTESSSHRNFNFLWFGQTINLFGDQLLLIALPLLAISLSGVSTAQAALTRFAFLYSFLIIWSCCWTYC